MDATIRELRKEELLTTHGGWFDEENAERVAKWLVAAEDRPPVLLVGAGYSRNAKDRETGVGATPAQAPLWGDLVTRLASDVGLKPKYDAPTLFELYGEVLGEAKLRDALRGCFADAALVPGPAHEAIAAYPCEAIGTTNCLDTLLDKCCSVGWRRVVEDSDLSVQGQLRDLIYLHGHRDYADSWVMTRSQYEDFSRSKPVMVARTRQLLAQHPWLVVGFGMTDPNFHSITRLLGAEMRRRQPLSLVLMAWLPSPAERQHWRGLGFEIVAPDRTDNLSEFFTWALSKLTTSYSPTSEAASAYVKRASDPGDRLRRFRDMNPTPIIDRQSAYREWETLLLTLLSEQERTEVAEGVQLASRALFGLFARLGSETGGSAIARVPPAPPMQSKIMRALDSDPDVHSIAADQTMQVLDRLLVGNTLERASLAEYFAWALEKKLFEYSNPRPVMEIATVCFAKEAGWSKARIGKLVKAAYELVRKYEHASTQAVLVRQLASLGLEAPVSAPEPDEPYLTEAQEGYRAFLDAKFDQAAKHYAVAARVAAAAKLDLETWAYTVGQLESLGRTQPLRPETADPVVGLRGQVERLTHVPVVKYWLERADDRLRTALGDNADEVRTRERYRITGNQGHKWSSAINSAWRSYRDLQAIYAPISLQRYYLAPVASFFDANEVRSVLVGVQKPREWVHSLLRTPPASLDARQLRDSQLVSGILGISQSPLLKSERLAAIECFPALISAFRTEDMLLAIASLTETIGLYPDQWQETVGGRESVTADYWAAFAACAHWANAEDALVVARILLAQSVVDHGEAARAFVSLPWSAWAPSMAIDTARGFVDALTSLLPSEAEDPWRSSRVASLLFSLLAMISAGLTPNAISRDQVLCWEQALDGVKVEKRTPTRYSETKRAGYLLERELQRCGLLGEISSEKQFVSWFGVESDSSFTQDDREELWLSLSEGIECKGVVVAPLLKRLDAEVTHFLTSTDAQKRYALNPHLALAPVRLLVFGLRLLEARRAEIASALLGLIQQAPEHVCEVGPALSKECWSDASWRVLRALFVAFCGGGLPAFFARRHEDPGLSTRCQRAMLALFGREDRKAHSTAEAESELWRPVQTFALASVNDERLSVAYAAAFSIVQTAVSIEARGDAELFAAAMLRIADDPRVEVRSAIARDGIKLTERAVSNLIKDAAKEAVARLRSDNNAQVTTLLERAKDREARSRLAPATSSPAQSKNQPVSGPTPTAGKQGEANGGG